MLKEHLKAFFNLENLHSLFKLDVGFISSDNFYYLLEGILGVISITLAYYAIPDVEGIGLEERKKFVMGLKFGIQIITFVVFIFAIFLSLYIIVALYLEQKKLWLTSFLLLTALPFIIALQAEKFFSALFWNSLSLINLIIFCMWLNAKLDSIKRKEAERYIYETIKKRKEEELEDFLNFKR